jgi:hypothetical protein
MKKTKQRSWQKRIFQIRTEWMLSISADVKTKVDLLSTNTATLDPEQCGCIQFQTI